MHELTASEAATLLSVLSKSSSGDTPDNDHLGIPASTFFATRRRIYEAGWLTDRYVPNPWAVGVLRIEFVLATPGPTERGRLEREWADSNATVVLWSGLNVLFGIFCGTVDAGPRVEAGTIVGVEAHTGSVPVYFDYSRAWSRFIRVGGETGYPRSLGAPLPVQGRTTPKAVSDLALQDQDGPSEARAAHRWHSVAGLSRIEQRLLERGIVRSRTFLNLDSVPAYDGRSLGEIVFVTGKLRSGVSSADVLGALTNDCRVSPILVADDGSRILILALGQVRPGATQRTRVQRAEGPVAATLDRALTNVQVTIEPTDSVRRTVDHRYDRLLSSGRSDEVADPT